MLIVEYLSKEDLKPYANNAKLHTGEQVEQIKKSITEFGFNDPIAIWHENEVIEGHGRLLAAMEMKTVDKVPVIRLDDLTDEQRRAYMLVHNKLTMNTGFVLELLEERLSEITDIQMKDYGFEDIDALSEELTDFFTPTEREEKADTINDPETIKFVISPKEEDKDDLIEFLEGEEIDYETA